MKKIFIKILKKIMLILKMKMTSQLKVLQQKIPNMKDNPSMQVLGVIKENETTNDIIFKLKK